MTLVYVMVCCVPFLIIILTFMLIGGASARAYRAGKDLYVEIQPSIENLKKSAEQAQARSNAISEKSKGLSETMQELSGRFAFLQGSYEEIVDSPAVRAASLAGRVRGRK